MAARGFWECQFLKGCAEAVAKTWSARLVLSCELEAWLEREGVDRIVQMTDGKRGVEDLGRAAAVHMNLVGRAIDELEQIKGPLDEKILHGLNCTGNHGRAMRAPHTVFPKDHPGRSRSWSPELEDQMAYYVGNLIFKSSWWRKNMKEFRSSCHKLSQVRSVQSS